MRRRKSAFSYLSFCYDQLSSLNGSLVTFGFNFGGYDDHIVDALRTAADTGSNADPKLRSIYVGIYSEKDIPRIQGVVNTIKCKAHYYDARSIQPWG